MHIHSGCTTTTRSLESRTSRRLGACSFLNRRLDAGLLLFFSGVLTRRLPLSDDAERQDGILEDRPRRCGDVARTGTPTGRECGNLAPGACLRAASQKKAPRFLVDDVAKVACHRLSQWLPGSGCGRRPLVDLSLNSSRKLQQAGRCDDTRIVLRFFLALARPTTGTLLVYRVRC